MNLPPAALPALLLLAAAVAPAAVPAPADPPEPGDLGLRVLVDDTPVLPGSDDDPRDLLVPVTFHCLRETDRSFRATLVVGTPEGDRETPVDLRIARSKEVVADLAVGQDPVSFPVRAVAGATRLLEMDLRLARVPAWWSAGPFPGGPEALHDAALEAEVDLPPMTGDAPGRGRRTEWTLLDPGRFGPGGVADLAALFPGPGGRTVVVATKFRAAREGTARLLLGSDDSVRAWWNGKLVHDRNVLRGCRPGEDAVPVTLRRGVNTLALKICQASGGWAFAASVDDGAGNPVEGLRPLTRVHRPAPDDGRLRLLDAGRGSAVLEWRTRDPVPSRLLLDPALDGRARPVPPGVPKESMVPADPPGRTRVVEDPLPRTRHRLVVEGLPPASRWIADADGGDGASAGILSFRTLEPRGVSQILRLRVAVVLFTNAVPAADAGRPGARDGVPEEEIARAERGCEEAAAFFFRNSGMRLWMDNEFLEDRAFRAIPEGSIYGVGLQPGGGHEEALLRLLEERGETPGDYDAVAYVTLDRAWDGSGWARTFSGGGTYGPVGRFGIGNSSWKGGHDCGWLYVHEVGHQVDALYADSGAPEFPFNHFQPWDGTAQRHGDHFDGNAWLLRWWGGVLREREERPGFRWFLSRWGEAVAVADGDGDGVPDDDPRLPLDERRLGSDPGMRDTDGDGLDDLGEALATLGLEQGLQEVWAGPAASHRCDPRRADSDGDGIGDGEDPEPTSAAPAVIPRAAPEIDGTLAAGEWPDFVRIDEPECRGTLHLAAGEGRILLAGRMEAGVREVQVRIDGDDDGWYVGRDNLLLVIAPGGAPGGGIWRALGEGGAGRVALHNCGVPGKWPFFDSEPPAAEGFAFASSLEGEGGSGAWSFEAAILRDPSLGIGAERGEPMGVHVAVFAEGGLRRPGFEGALTPFEPHAYFRFRVGGE